MPMQIVEIAPGDLDLPETFGVLKVERDPDRRIIADSAQNCSVQHSLQIAGFEFEDDTLEEALGGRSPTSVRGFGRVVVGRRWVRRFRGGTGWGRTGSGNLLELPAFCSISRRLAAFRL